MKKQNSIHTVKHVLRDPAGVMRLMLVVFIIQISGGFYLLKASSSVSCGVIQQPPVKTEVISGPAVDTMAKQASASVKVTTRTPVSTSRTVILTACKKSNRTDATYFI